MSALSRCQSTCLHCHKHGYTDSSTVAAEPPLHSTYIKLLTLETKFRKIGLLNIFESSNTTEIISTTLNYTTDNYHLHITHSDIYQTIIIFTLRTPTSTNIYPVPRQCHLTLQVADISCTAHNNVQRRNSESRSSAIWHVVRWVVPDVSIDNDYLRNVGNHIPKHTWSNTRRPQSAGRQLWAPQISRDCSQPTLHVTTGLRPVHVDTCCISNLVTFMRSRQLWGAACKCSQ
jgi:hypothetical protein